MPAAFSSWDPLPHGPLVQLSNNLWTLTGDLPKGALKRVMTIARQQNGKLLIHNGIAVNPQTLALLTALGEPEFLIVPNGWHRLDCLAYQQKFPSLKTLCPKAASLAVKKVAPLSGSLDDYPADDSIACQHIPGTRDGEGVFTIRSLDGVSLVFNDIIFNVPHFKGIEGFVFRLIGSTGGPKITTIARLALIRDKKATRAFLEQLASTRDLRRIIVSHGQMMTTPSILQELARTL